MRAAIGAISGYVVWSALWLGGNTVLGRVYPDETAAFEAGGEMTAAGPLLVALVLSVVCSVVAGLVAAAIARRKARAATLWMAVALLVTGIGVQASVWSRMPLWYHAPFLALLVPVCLVAGRPARAS